MDVGHLPEMRALDQQFIQLNAQVDERLQQCFQQFLQSLEAGMQGLIQEISRTKNISEAQPVIQIYQELMIWAKTAALGGYIEFAQKADEIRKVIIADQFAIYDKALEVKRELMRQEVEFQALLIQRNNQILQSQAESMALRGQGRCRFRKEKPMEERPHRHHGHHDNGGGGHHGLSRSHHHQGPHGNGGGGHHGRRKHHEPSGTCRRYD